MKRTLCIASIGFLVGVGAARVAVWACEGLTLALTRWGGWQAAQAAKAAPVILLALAAGLALSLWGLHEDNKRYSNSGLGKIEGYSARQKSSTNDKEMGA